MIIVPNRMQKSAASTNLIKELFRQIHGIDELPCAHLEHEKDILDGISLAQTQETDYIDECIINYYPVVNSTYLVNLSLWNEGKPLLKVYTYEQRTSRAVSKNLSI